MTRQGPFALSSGSTVLVRVPLLPAAEYATRPTTVDPLLAEGIFMASRQASAGVATADIDSHRLAVTRRAYEVRARFRPTPHGAFAGVAVAGIADNLYLHLAGKHRTHTYPSAAWLARFADRVLDMPEVLDRLTLTTSNLIIHRGHRLEHEQPARPGVTAPQRVSIRATEASRFVLRLCDRGAPYQTIAGEAVRRWPSAPAEVIRSTVVQLVSGAFLLADLVPDSDAADPLGHLLDKLPGSCSLRPALGRLREHLHDADQCPLGSPHRLAHLTAARTVCDELVYVDRPLSADVVADVQVTVPVALAAEAVEAVGVLWRVGQGRDRLTGYHRRFLERYGPGRFVPLLGVADPLVGLGDVDDVADPGTEAPPPERATILAALHYRAVACGRTEVELDEETVGALDRHRLPMVPPPTAEVYTKVVAASEQDRAAGRLSLAIYDGGTQHAGSTVGRFAALLPEVETAPPDVGPALVAEVVVRPRTPELAGIASPSGFVSTRIPIGVPVREGDLDPRDLQLVSNGERLMLWSAERDRQVMPVLYSRIGSRYLPPLARLLQALSIHGCRPWHGWSWEPLHSMFYPRVRYKRTILSPARWRLPPSLTGTSGDRSRWEAALLTWQTTTVPRPPSVVVVADADRHLPLDLRQAVDCALLRRYVRRGHVLVAEQPGGPDAVHAIVPGPTGWHVLELVIPLARRVAGPPASPAEAPVRPVGDGLHLPGSEWLSVAIPSPSSCHDEILVALADLAIGLPHIIDRWFWLRYHNTAHGPHLRVRLHGDPAALGNVILPTVSRWCSDLIAQRLASGLVVEPYDQEIERYGGHQAIEAAESAFDADSRLVLAAISGSRDTDHRLVIAALSAAAIARTVAGGDLAALDGRSTDRAARRRIASLRPRVRTAADTGSQAFSSIRALWVDRDSALARYRDRLHEGRRIDCASSLIHMHANRLLGERESERIARALAADLLARKVDR